MPEPTNAPDNALTPTIQIRSKKPPAFQLYAQDFDSDTAAMRPEELGVYFRLLLSQWINGSVPDTETANVIKSAYDSQCDRNAEMMARLASIARISLQEFEKLWPRVRHYFACGPDDCYRNPRMEEEREKQSAYRKRISLAGQIGAASRWNGDTERAKSATSESGDRNASAMRPECDEPSDRNGLQSSSSSSKTIKSKPAFEGQTLKITEGEDRGFRTAFPWADFAGEYAKMDSWLVANPQNRKKNFGRFAHNWLSRILKPKTQARLPELKPYY